jgi:hypothetical protein
MAVVIPTQNRNAAVATDNMTKMMAINLKIPKYDISSAFDDRSVGGRSFKLLELQWPGKPVDAFPGPSTAPSLLATSG